MKERRPFKRTGFRRGGAMILRTDVLSWPVVRAYVPDQDAWRATGFGTAGIVRERPNGRWAHSFFSISLLDNGIVAMFGKDSTAKEFEKTISHMRDVVPPFQNGTVELVSDYVWGAYALTEKHGVWWEPDVSRYLCMVPRPAGNKQQWLDRLIGPSGLTPPDLLMVIRENPQPGDLPEGKEIMIFTEMSFRIDDEQEVIAKLRGHEPEFSYHSREGEEECFTWTREYPPDHWSPLASLGGRQVLGDIRVKPGRLVAEVKTLSMACRLIFLLKNIIGEKLTLEKTTWAGIKDILQTKKQ